MGERRLAATLLTAGAWLSARRLQALFTGAKPDLVVSTHPLVQGMTLYTLRRLGLSPPFATVVTDLATAHPLWFDPGVDLCFVASAEAARRARQAGLAAAQIRLTGVPIRPAFAQALRPRAALRDELGLAPELPAVLLLGGGEGMGPVAAIARATAAALADPAGPRGQVAVICGRNQKLRASLAALDWPVPVQVMGFVDNMADWMAACDCLVTKAGPGSIAEALSQGLPLILSSYIPGQEEGNVPYIVDNGAGVYCREPDAIARLVRRWFTDERPLLSQMSERARQLGRPAAVFDIVDGLAELADTVGARRP
jgi:1,2-diacylglycerol 3-beta-galactosyltransferase